MTEQRFLTVTALTRYLKRKFEMDPHLQDVWIKGELSNFKWHSRGHMYFTLKDENARIQCVMFAGDNRRLTFKPEDGMKVLIRGEIAIYEAYGQYQLYVKEMELDGIGNLFLAFEELKKRLEREGLFDQQKKKPIPKFPEHICVITSPTGAAIRDIITTIRRRYPIVRITILPVLVQGEEAASSIANAIRYANMIGTFDVIISGRGGGSIEDLWPFNEEIVARAIYESEIPIISAVGHETDFTIADFVADMRAPTPTAAAELAVPHIEELLEKVGVCRVRLMRAMTEKITIAKKNLQHLQKSYAFRYPRQLLNQKEQELDRLIDRLTKEVTRKFEAKKEKFEHLYVRLKKAHPANQIVRENERLAKIVRQLERAGIKQLNSKQMQLNHLLAKLNALNPLKVMERGYSLAYRDDKKIIKSITQVEPGDKIKLFLTDGNVDCQVLGKEESDSGERRNNIKL
ncbi:exodeoxyribonuclease VII large subunit [Calidifontibacillus erzurumensis]|uniref:Exodeoxyribonuclease 7 large subunit n=1 Tax=Calidifontibacillus erzurumensis TaxID=2741433 RepID=A0A8J8GDR2_9BACI|nr:exodeoxyribonuclease VII large subunit [Calidifontibacillus erzurumensis]NSL50390.1 exodeoxyribonuclease VII large subunit [Calidifontibacillus erzurumensis]